MSIEPSKIVIEFNKAVDNLNKAIMARKMKEDQIEFRFKLDAGRAMYSACEWGMKSHLLKRLTASFLTKSQKCKLKGQVEKANIFKLIELMKQHALPLPSERNNTINFNLLLQLKADSRNLSEHLAEEPDLLAQTQAIEEIRKVILTYVDSKASLDIVQVLETIQSPKWEHFLTECDRFDTNEEEQYYVLITGPSQHVPKEKLKLIGRLPWTLVFDFDPYSRNNGFYEATYSDGQILPHRRTSNPLWLMRVFPIGFLPMVWRGEWIQLPPAPENGPECMVRL